MNSYFNNSLACIKAKCNPGALVRNIESGPIKSLKERLDMISITLAQLAPQISFKVKLCSVRVFFLSNVRTGYCSDLQRSFRKNYTTSGNIVLKIEHMYQLKQYFIKLTL